MLLCPAGCQRYWVVSEEDPDATLSEIIEHLTGPVHDFYGKEAMEWLAKLELAERPGGES